ncbi:MAG: 4-hydroxy-3-methylbut-2-enyl diphosphate reductase [Pseudomonadota bacterium]
MASAGKPKLRVRLASPRGFCAGVERAIRTVEEALADFGPPVYVRHEIVHNTHVIERLSSMGAVFVEDLADAPDDRPLIVSAHGAPASVMATAAERKMTAIDATCPLVHKVHAQVRRHARAGRHVYLIGHSGHPEVVGTMGQAPAGAVTLVEAASDVELLPDRSGDKAYVTQTTLSVEDTSIVIRALEKRFPGIIAPARQDICYATTNRQSAAAAAAKGVDLFLVFGSQTSSNSQRLVETARRAGAASAALIEDARGFDAALLENVDVIGISAGASAPEYLIEDFLKMLTELRTLIIETVQTATEDIYFNTPLRSTG